MSGAPSDADESNSLLTSDSVLSERLFRHVCWHVLPILWLGYALNIVDRTNLGYAQLQMSQDLGLSPREFGMASGLFFVSYAIMQVPFNHLIQRSGATRVLAFSMVGWGCISAATSLVQGERALYLLRFALGIAESGYYPGTLLFLTKWFPEAQAGRALACFSTAASVGGIIASAGSGITLSLLDGVCGIRGWRWLLATQGVPTIVLGALLPLAVCERPEDAAWLSADDRETLISALAARGGKKHVAPAPLLTSLRAALALPRTWGFVVQYVGVSCVMNGARFFAPSQIKEAYPRWKPYHIGLALSIVAMVKVVTSPAVARWAEATPARRERTVRGVFVAGGLLLLLGGAVTLCERERTPSALAGGVMLVTVCADVRRPVSSLVSPAVRRLAVCTHERTLPLTPSPDLGTRWSHRWASRCFGRSITRRSLLRRRRCPSHSSMRSEISVASSGPRSSALSTTARRSRRPCAAAAAPLAGRAQAALHSGASAPSLSEPYS